MPFETPSLDELHNRLLNDYRGRFPGGEFSRHGDNWKRLRTLAGGLWGGHYQQSIAEEDLYPDSAKGVALARIGTIWGVVKKGATPARKSNALRVFGTSGAAVAIGNELTSASGLRYQINENANVTSQLFVDVDVVAIDVGAATRLVTGDILTFTAPPVNIEAEAELQLDLDEDGEDEENDGAYSTRIIDKISQPGMGGNPNDYRQWSKEVTGVAEAYVYPLRRGFGSVDVAALHTGRGTVRLLTTQERTDLLAYLTALRPTGQKLLRVIQVTATEKDVDIQISAIPGTQFQWDWGDSVPLVVTSWTAGTRTLKFTASRPSDMEENDRLIIATTLGNGTGEEFEIEAMGGAADEVILKKAPSVAPVAGDTVYSGGDLVGPVRDAILAHMDSLGPAIGLYGTGEWVDQLQRGRLEAVAFGITGVRDVVVNVPASDQTPSDPGFPNDTTLELFIPGQIVVRRKF